MKLAIQSALIVDDDPLQCSIMEAFLRRCGIGHVGIAHQVSRARAEIAAGVFDLIICDLNMPGEDGVEFLGELHRARYGGAILIISGAKPIVAHTASKLIDAYRMNNCGCFTKPVDYNGLHAALSRLGTSS